MSEPLGSKVINGTLWAAFDRIGTMALQFIVNLILARLLTPADFGCIGMLAIFIAVSQILIDGGFGSALIQKKDPTQEDYSTIFYWNLFFAFILYGILFFSAPFIATFFNLPLLRNVLRTLGLILIINAFIIIQNNRLRKQLAFKTIAWINLCSLFAAAIIAIALAYQGAGVWSLVTMQLLYVFFQSCLLWSIVRWYPSLQFSMKSLKHLFNFGGYLLAANILQEICKNLQGILIGRRFSAIQMGYYAQAKKLDDVCSYALSNIFVLVLYPVYSQYQHDKQKLQSLLATSIRLIAYCIFPLMLLLILIAEPLILLLYGAKWMPAIPYFQILCLGGIFVCLQNINYYAVAAVGKSQALFKWSFYKWGVLLLLLLAGSHWGIYGILFGMVLSSINIYLVNAYLAFKYVGYAIWSQLKDFTTILIISILSFFSTYLLQIYLYHTSLILTVVVFLVIYLSLTWIFRLSVIADMIRIKSSVFK